MNKWASESVKEREQQRGEKSVVQMDDRAVSASTAKSEVVKWLSIYETELANERTWLPKWDRDRENVRYANHPALRANSIYLIVRANSNIFRFYY